MATALAEPLDLPRLRSATTELGMHHRQLEERVGRLPDLQEQPSRSAANLAAVDSELQTAWSDVQSRLGALRIHDESREVGPLRQRLQAEVRSLDETSTRSRLNTVIGEVADAAGAIGHRQEPIGEEERRVVAQLETMLDLRVIVLDLSDEQAKLDQLVRSREVKKRATRIITTARARMIDRVLPGTEQNLRLLLPQLTAERYYDAKLDGEYRLSVWDRAAQRYVAKDIFSGGTRDQFSLALRLAFALARLPQELGTTPGFIFLDEPLSEFDLPRTEALVELLTDGQIAKSSDQIFLISHSRSFDPSLFTYYVRMEAGRVAATNLPTPPALLAV